MRFLLLLLMLTRCAASPQDLSGKMFTFPQETASAHVRLNTSHQTFSAVTICLRSFTDLKRDHALFSLATPSAANSFLIFWDQNNKELEPHVKDNKAEYGGLDYKLNTWHSVCSTWDSATGLVQLWFDGQLLARKFVSGSSITGTNIIILGQEQDSHGGGFNAKQSFTGMMSDVHMWDYTLSHCEIHNYVDESGFTPGNVLNWKALDFQITGKVLIENKMMSYGAFHSAGDGDSMCCRSTRTFTDLKRDYAPFSLATPSFFNDFLIFKNANDLISINAKDTAAHFVAQDYRLNTWHPICATWDSSSGVGQLWLDGKPLNRRFIRSGSNISGPVIIVLGQDQDSYGGAFDPKQSFVGMMSDVHMWDYILTPAEIQDYADDQSFISGNVLSWRALEFQIRGRVL
ncbi:hypothetical protein INR49_024115, partial [Caranx melampygus]